MSERKITVNNILQSPCFEKAKIIAGFSGVNRPVKWIHILDAQIFTSLTGGEFILSTGSVFTNLENGISFLEHLIERKVSGLCVELVAYITSIPDEMIKIADENDFPLVVFTESVNFIDITLDLHTTIINQNAVSFSKIEKYSQQLNQILLSPHDIEDIIISVHRFLGINVAYLPIEGKAFFNPSLPPAEQKKFLEMFRQLIMSENTGHGLNTVLENIYVACRTIAALDRKMGEAIVFSTRPITDFDSLILEKAAVAIAQDLLRDLFVKEKKRHKENFWIKDWLNGRLKEKDILQMLEGSEELDLVSGYTVCIVEFITKISPQKTLNQFMIHTTIFLRPLFEQEGFLMFGTYDNNKIIYALLDKEPRLTWKKRITRVIGQFKVRRNSIPNGVQITVGIGRISDRPTDIYKSFQTALEAVNIQKNIKREEPLYDSLNVFRLVSQVDKTGNLNEYIQDYLAPVIQYDNEHNAELIKTLQVYCECSASKQKTAERLFIVRQTLYLRIQKLEELLGEDFMMPEKRLAIEFALYAYQFRKGVTNSYKG